MSFLMHLSPQLHLHPAEAALFLLGVLAVGLWLAKRAH
jgi:hypothetical protein